MPEYASRLCWAYKANLTTQGVGRNEKNTFGFMSHMSLAAGYSRLGRHARILGISDINSLVYGTTQYGNEYVGPIGSALNNTPITGGITCFDIDTQTYVPTSFDVYVGSLSPVDLSHAKFATQPDDLFHYQEAAALLGQMPSILPRLAKSSLLSGVSLTRVQLAAKVSPMLRLKILADLGGWN